MVLVSHDDHLDFANERSWRVKFTYCILHLAGLFNIASVV